MSAVDARRSPSSVGSSWLAIQAPRAVVGTRQISDVSTARPMVAATLPRIALVTAP